MSSGIVLRHLVLVPRSGMCNRLRAIASARRLCLEAGAKCSIVWTWGDFQTFFDPAPDIEIIHAPTVKTEKKVQHRIHRLDPFKAVDTAVTSVELHSGYLFWGSHEAPIHLSDIVPFVPRLNPHLMNRVEVFSRERLRNAVGVHIRRNDHVSAIRRSPDTLFLRRISEVVSAGKKVFLATDNLQTELKLKRRFGDAIIIYPKRKRLEMRWPRAFDQSAAEDDLIDFFLLTRTEYILGCHASSFSRLAIAFNGSNRCEILETPPHRLIEQWRLGWHRMNRIGRRLLRSLSPRDRGELTEFENNQSTGNN